MKLYLFINNIIYNLNYFYKGIILKFSKNKYENSGRFLQKFSPKNVNIE